MSNTPLSVYRKDLESPEFEPDKAQLLAVENLQRLYDELLGQPEPKMGFFERLG